MANRKGSPQEWRETPIKVARRVDPALKIEWYEAEEKRLNALITPMAKELAELRKQRLNARLRLAEWKAKAKK